MKIAKICELLDAVPVTGNLQNNWEYEVEKVFASDLMSDVLTVSEDTHLLMLTGLNNVQTLRTAEMADIHVIVVVRGKKVSQEMIALARENNIVLCECKYSLFKASGILYSTGLASIY